MNRMNSATRWIPIWIRHVRVWRKLFWPSILGNFGEPLIYLLALGHGLGQLVGSIDGMPYIVFLMSGIVCSSAMNAASLEGTYAAYMRMNVQRTWLAMIAAPLSVRDVILGEVLWMGTKSLINVTSIIIVASCLGLVYGIQVIFILPVIFLAGCCFGAMALVVTAFAHGYDFFMYYFTLLMTPMMLLSGVFFPISQLPLGIQWLASCLPLYHAVSIVRPVITAGVMPPNLFIHLGVLTIFTVTAFTLATHAIRRRILV